MQDVHDYLAGRTQEIDDVIDWVEKQPDEINSAIARSYNGCLGCAVIEEVSRQMWSFLGPLVRENSDNASIFKSVPRHNGLEAWSRIAEPINEDKSLMRKDLLPLVNNLKGAANIDKFAQRLEDWDTSCRLMVENGGEMPSDETRRLAFIEMLPADVNAYVTMRMDDAEYDTFGKIKMFALKNVKVLQKQEEK